MNPNLQAFGAFLATLQLPFFSLMAPSRPWREGEGGGGGGREREREERK